jgi:hypothetical protein
MLPRDMNAHLVVNGPTSDASTLRTSDWDKPNCRAVTDGLMPALTAARTPTRQRDRRGFLLPPMGRFVRSRRTVRGLIAWRQSAAPLHFLEDCRVEKVQLVVTQMLDGFTQVLRQHMSLRGRIAWLCDRNGTCWRWRPASDHLGREKVRCRLLTTIASHGGGSCLYQCQ